MDREVRAGLAPGEASGADEQLWQRLKRRDEEAYGTLWRRFGPGLRRYALARLGGDEEGADDVVVQSMAAAIQSIASYNPRRSPLAPWLYGIARRVLIAEVRRQQRRASVPRSAQVTLEAAASLATGGDLASATTAHLEARRKAVLLASYLPAAEMEVLLLHFVEEFSAREIAHIIHRSEQAVYSLLHRATERARERLVQDEA